MSEKQNLSRAERSSSPSVIRLEGVTKNFRVRHGNEIQVHKDNDLFVVEREIVAFLGPSGCGKTTTLKIMSGLLKPSEGRVMSYGRPLEGINGDLALVFQNFALLPWFTVEENVALGVRQQGLSPKK